MLTHDPIASGELREVIPDQYAVCLKPGHRWDGYIFYKHPDGQWVSLQRMTPEERSNFILFEAPHVE